MSSQATRALRDYDGGMTHWRLVSGKGSVSGKTRHLSHTEEKRNACKLHIGCITCQTPVPSVVRGKDEGQDPVDVGDRFAAITGLHHAHGGLKILLGHVAIPIDAPGSNPNALTTQPGALPAWILGLVHLQWFCLCDVPLCERIMRTSDQLHNSIRSDQP